MDCYSIFSRHQFPMFVSPRVVISFLFSTSSCYLFSIFPVNCMSSISILPPLSLAKICFRLLTSNYLLTYYIGTLTPCIEAVA